MGIRLSDTHLMYSLASVFEMVSSLVFTVSIFKTVVAVAVPFVISLSAIGSVGIVVLCSRSYSMLFVYVVSFHTCVL